MDLEQATIIFLVSVFIIAEIFRIFRGTRGVITAFDDAGLAALLPVNSVRIKLHNGREIQAKLNCCTACLGRLKVGDEVRVTDTKDGYVVDLPWFRKSGKSSCFRFCEEVSRR